MNLSHSLNKLLGIGCVVLLCAAFSAAKTHKSATARSARSSHAASAPKAHKNSARSSSKTRSASSTRSKRSHKAAKSTATRKPRGQQAIAGDRAREIQSALIRENYLAGEPTGVWDQRTRDAMTRFQSDNGWQTKVIPDSRALIKLGLGPKHADLINPESLETTLPQSARESRPGGAPR